jgi:hypothetical protein
VLRIRIRIILGSLIWIRIKVESWIRIRIIVKSRIQSEKVEALESHFGALEGPNLEKVSGRIGIRIKVKSRIQISIKMMRFRNTVLRTSQEFLNPPRLL